MRFFVLTFAFAAHVLAQTAGPTSVPAPEIETPSPVPSEGPTPAPSSDFSLCKDPADFTPAQAVEVQCLNVTEATCWNILGFAWNDDDAICETEFWTRATADMRDACTAAGGTPDDTQTCLDHEAVLMEYLVANNISTEEPLDVDSCATLLTGETLGLQGSFFTFLHSTTVCCGGQPHLGACDPDESAICADIGYYTPDRFLHMNCHGVNQTMCEDDLPGFEWEMDEEGGHYVCKGPASGETACEEAQGSVDPDLSCAEVNTIYALLEVRYQLDFETQAGCDSFFENVADEFGPMDETNPLLTNSFLNYVGAPLCCDGMPTVCTTDDPYSICADTTSFVADNPARLECHGLTLEQCLSLDGFDYDVAEESCLTKLFMEANEGYEDACTELGGTVVVDGTCAEQQAFLSIYFEEMAFNAPFNESSCVELLGEVSDPITALYWFEHLPVACCGESPPSCDFDPVDVCTDSAQFTPDAPARLQCFEVTEDECTALGSVGFELEDDDTCQTRLFYPIQADAATECTDIGGIPLVEATCELNQYLATYLFAEHQVYNLSADGQCQAAVDGLQDPEYSVYFFQHLPVVCCGGIENAVCTVDDLDSTCENQILFYQGPEFDNCTDPTDLTADPTCTDECLADIQSLIDDLGCCLFDYLEVAYGDVALSADFIFAAVTTICPAANTTTVQDCTADNTTMVPNPSPEDVDAASGGSILTVCVLTAISALGLTAALQ